MSRMFIHVSRRYLISIEEESPLRRFTEFSKCFGLIFLSGGRIDHGHNDSTAYRALTDTVAFDEAVTAAIDATNRGKKNMSSYCLLH